MKDEKSFKKSRILVKRKSDGLIIADTVISDYDPVKNRVFIDAFSAAKFENQEMAVLIFGDTGLFEFSGRINNTIVSNEICINLYSGHRKENRRDHRYKISSVQGALTYLWFMDSGIRLAKPIPFQVVNISVGGIMIEMDIGSLSVGDRFNGEIFVNEDRLVMSCKVVHIEDRTAFTEKYGCQVFQFVKNL